MADDRDDFSVFADSRHMFFGLDEPFAYIRSQIEGALLGQVQGSVVDAIRAREPRFLTMGRKVDDGRSMVVTHSGCCFRADIAASWPAGDERASAQLEGTFTMFFGGLDSEEDLSVRIFLDLGEDAEEGHSEARFQQRMLAFRLGVDDEPEG